MSLLSDLCKICNTNLPKYQCPGCKSRTCSLLCYKRHKKWYTCSGKRDPAAHVPRSQLATPAGIDHDFNFLTGIERSFDRADRDVDERGIQLESSIYPVAIDGSNMKNALDASGAILHRAPKGMSRERQNKTKWDYKRKSLRWSVEWVMPDMSKNIGSLLATQPLSRFFALREQHYRPAKRQKLDSPTEQPYGSQEDASTLGTHPEDMPSAKQLEDTNGQPQKANAPNKIKEEKLHFYLHKPYTSSSSRVLIPLSPTATLSTCLRGRDILEFPTIYALAQPPSALPSGHILEKDYFKQRQKLVREVDEALGEGYKLPAVKEKDSARVEAEDYSAPSDSRILESLQRDIDVVRQYV
ncbi:MAG: hypothetical protein M1828_004674 [Chrysothrix sp. TS-e1954]|nr:MAG: hypothetical protein M1828_004674 [Chrysothrix sp. TS-e1954]